MFKAVLRSDTLVSMIYDSFYKIVVVYRYVRVASLVEKYFYGVVLWTKKLVIGFEPPLLQSTNNF